jgi:benzoylformate decarboxylase
VDITGIARALGCPARTVSDHAELLAALDEVLPGLAGRTEPLLLEVAITPEATFTP